jgi:hypothetical protein
VADRVRERAGGYDPARLMLILVMALPFAAGWVLAKMCRVVWKAGTWLFAAAAEGWASGWPSREKRPR